MTIGLTVDCPYSANLTRSYTLFLDPVSRAPAETTRTPITLQRVTPPAAQSATPAAAPVAANRSPQKTPSQPVTNSPPAEESPVPLTGSYRVQIGDTLSGIASRIENRPVGLWQAVGAIFDANPTAFIDGDLNRLKAGSVLSLPSFNGKTVTSIAAAEQSIADNGPSPATGAAENGAGQAYSGPTLEPVLETAAVAQPEPAAEVAATFPAITQDTDAESLQGTNASATSDAPANESAGTDSVETPGVTAADNARSDNATPGIEPVETLVEPSMDGSSQLLFWLGGSGLALLLGFAVFRSRSRVQPASPGGAAIIDEPETADDHGSDATTDLDFDIGVQAETQQQVLLDADLNAGTGLNDTSDVEVAQDFGFTTAMERDGISTTTPAAPRSQASGPRRICCRRTVL